MLEVCCGSYYDAYQAYIGGAKRIELNCGLLLGGLTPSIASLTLTKTHCPEMQVIAMVRPRGAGFCYSEEDFQVMEQDCELLLQNGADGIAFGCLREDASLHLEQNKRLIDRIHGFEKEAVFHRAFDCSSDPAKTIEQLIDWKVDRILTSGLQPTALEGAALLKDLQKQYGHQIQILAGSGINAQNVVKLMKETGLTQVHSSCKDWKTDSTTQVKSVSFSYAPAPNTKCYEVVSAEKVRDILKVIGTWEE